MFGWITRPWKSNTGAGLMLLSLQLGIHPRNVCAPTFSSSSCSFHVRGLLWKWVGGFFGAFFSDDLSVIGVLVQRLRAGSGVLCKSKLYGFTTVHVRDLWKENNCTVEALIRIRQTCFYKLINMNICSSQNLSQVAVKIIQSVRK